MKQKLCNSAGEVHAEVDVLAGPHEWLVGGHVFRTVLVKCPDDTGKQRSVVDCRSGQRFGRVECSAPKTKPHSAVQAVSRLIDERRQAYGDEAVVKVLKGASAIPEL